MLSTLLSAIIIVLIVIIILTILALLKYKQRIQKKRERKYVSRGVEHMPRTVKKKAGEQAIMAKTETEAETPLQLETSTVEPVNSQTPTKLTSEADTTSSNSNNECAVPVRIKDLTSGLTVELIPIKVWKLAPPDKRGVKIGLFKSPITGKYFRARLPDDYPECGSINTR